MASSGICGRRWQSVTWGTDLHRILESQGPTSHYPHSSVPFPSLGLFQLSLCGESSHINMPRVPLNLAQSIRAVKLWQFVIATCFVFPRILLETFIGSKMAELSDGKQRGDMDTSKVFCNCNSI